MARNDQETTGFDSGGQANKITREQMTQGNREARRRETERLRENRSNARHSGEKGGSPRR